MGDRVYECCWWVTSPIWEMCKGPDTCTGSLCGCESRDRLPK